MMIAKSTVLQSVQCIAGIFLLALMPVAVQAGQDEDAAFLAARDAFAQGERGRFERAFAGLQAHPLRPWAEYFRFSLRLGEDKDDGIAEFLERHEGSYLAEKMRTTWLKWLVGKKDWAEARRQFVLLKRPDAESTCLGLEARMRLGEPEAVDLARDMLGRPAPLPEACRVPMERLARAGEVSEDELWQRMRRQLAQGRLKEARIVAGWLPAHEAPAWRSVESVVDHPARHLARLPENFAARRSGRELAMFAVLRMARSDARVAAVRWADIESRFATNERAFVWGRLALLAAFAHQSEAGAWFERAAALEANFDEEQAGWRIRAALRREDWPAVAQAVDALPEALKALPEWRYWHGRALAAQGAADAAQADYLAIAGQPNFYGILAAEALGRTYRLPSRAVAPSEAELAAIAVHPGLQRGLALIQADLRTDGVREWFWSLGGMDDRQLLAAAELARRHDVIDRAINTADRTREEHDFVLRYPLPFFDEVAPRAREVGLDAAWVYGLMRQESRFITDARSSAGARGLMQLMPATARWVANKIGMDHYHPRRMTDMDTNIRLGTNYLRMVLDGLDDHPVLASAAYNAGPSRARRWRAERPLEGAIYAETIPFSETRDYVKKVMANTVHYAALLDGRTPSLTAWLGIIRPRGFGDTTAESLP